jgi:hypothetical protein
MYKIYTLPAFIKGKFKEGNSMSQFAVAFYRPQAGKEDMLIDVIRQHFPVLLAEGLVTERLPYLTQAKDGTVIEVFEWKSKAAREKAHRSEAVGRLWQKFFECAAFSSLSLIEEAHYPCAPLVKDKKFRFRLKSACPSLSGLLRLD